MRQRHVEKKNITNILLIANVVLGSQSTFLHLDFKPPSCSTRTLNSYMVLTAMQRKHMMCPSNENTTGVHGQAQSMLSVYELLKFCTVDLSGS